MAISSLQLSIFALLVASSLALISAQAPGTAPIPAPQSPPRKLAPVPAPAGLAPMASPPSPFASTPSDSPAVSPSTSTADAPSMVNAPAQAPKASSASTSVVSLIGVAGALLVAASF